MARFRISPQAERDIEAILRWTHETFGEKARLRYEALLIQANRDVAENPDRAGSRNRSEITPTARTYHLRLLTARSMKNGQTDEWRKKPWFIRRQTSSLWEEGKQSSPMARDATETLEPFRKYLTVLAELHLDHRLRGKLDASDVVQQTMLRAYSALAEVRDTRPEVLVAWLRRILARTLADAVKHHERDKRDIALERSLEADLDRSASGFAAWLAADQTSPSARAERNEELMQLVEALAELPEAMREVVVLKHCQGWTLTQIAGRIGRSAPAVASLLRRGLEELRNRMKTGE